MTRTCRLGLVAALTFFSASSLPRLSYGESLSATWVGVESYQVTNYDSNFQPISVSSGTIANSTLFIDIESTSALLRSNVDR